MSKSLNQAFIRAYSKERASRPVPPPVVVDTQLNNHLSEHLREHLNGQLNEQPSEQFGDAGLIDFVVRFDTATCGVPAAHRPAFTRSSDGKPREAVASGPRRTPGRLPTRAAAAPPTRVATLPRPQDEAALRGAIAEQMNRAGEWDGSTASAFQGDFPMLSQRHQRAASVRTVPIQPQASPLPANPFHANRESTAASQVASSQVVSSQFSPRSSESPQREIHTPSLQSPALLSQQTKPGDFFRLDRPSYSPAPAVQADGEYSDSGDSSSEILGLSASQVNLESCDTAAPSETVLRGETRLRKDAAHAAKIERVQSAERELRRSKLRIFNPVWEVDSFQWPDICLELLEQRSEVLETVAGNLNEAVQEGLQVLAITSPQGGEGRTTVACCLAKLVGSRGLNVAIVDGDIDNPTLSYQTNLDIHQDWKSAILNQLPLEEIAVHSIDDQVTLVPLIGAIDDSELSVDDNRIEFMLHELSESFDLVIVDMGHMNSPRSLVGSLCARGVISAVVAVVDHRTTSAQEIDHCLRRIRQAGVASIGVVENFAA